MMIGKIQEKKDNFCYNEWFYCCARDAMFDFVNFCVNKGYKKILIPGYVGWSANEGSGIFDPINKINSLERDYYLLDEELQIKEDDLLSKTCHKSIVLIVNYFGFRDRKINIIIDKLRDYDVIILEDNAHSFFTYHENKVLNTDASFFSLHKLFPFEEGGSLIIDNKSISYHFTPALNIQKKYDPYSYHLKMISEKRKENFKSILKLITKYADVITPLRNLNDIKDNTPQTFPVILKKGNRDKIYEIMNENGYGVVSLYHTLINELDNERYKHTHYISRHIMNLPLHQDTDAIQYDVMISNLYKYCLETSDCND